MAQKPLARPLAQDPPPVRPPSTIQESLTAIADRLEAAADLRISHMDSDSRVATINETRTNVMRACAAELRRLS